jgi:hypothetical protein
MNTTDEVSMLAVASYHCIMCILVMSIRIELGRWESHITILECSWARSVRKLYDYSGVLLWIMSPLAGRDRTGTALYVARGGVRCSFIPCWVWRQWTCICIALHSLRFVYIEVLCWHEVEMRSTIFIYMRSIILFIWGYYLFIVYQAQYMFMEISMDKYSYHEPLFSLTRTLLYWNWCLMNL